MATSDLNNLPPELFSFSGEWEPYETALYKIFQETLLNEISYFQGTRIGIKKVPEYKGKHFVFWHLISEGEKEEERTPDMRRCERLGWVKWIIENCDTCPDISWWENKRGSQKHVVIWYEKGNYAVVLARRNNYYLLKTAYLVNPRRAKSFTQERESFRKNKA